MGGQGTVTIELFMWIVGPMGVAIAALAGILGKLLWTALTTNEDLRKEMRADDKATIGILVDVATFMREAKADGRPKEMLDLLNKIDKAVTILVDRKCD